MLILLSAGYVFETTERIWNKFDTENLKHNCQSMFYTAT